MSRAPPTPRPSASFAAIPAAPAIGAAEFPLVVGVGVGAGGGIGSGACADEDLEAAVLGPRHRGADRSLLPRGGDRGLSQSVECSALLCGARAFLESGAGQDGSGWPLCSFYAARLGAALLVCLRLRLCT